MNPLLEDIEFLEHFGIKGMRWGVRRKTGFAKPPSAKNSARRRKAFVVGSRLAGIAAISAAGAVATRKIMKATGHNKVSALLPTWAAEFPNGDRTFGFEGAKVMKMRVKDIRNYNPFGSLS